MTPRNKRVLNLMVVQYNELTTDGKQNKRAMIKLFAKCVQSVCPSVDRLWSIGLNLYNK